MANLFRHDRDLYRDHVRAQVCQHLRSRSCILQPDTNVDGAHDGHGNDRHHAGLHVGYVQIVYHQSAGDGRREHWLRAFPLPRS